MLLATQSGKHISTQRSACAERSYSRGMGRSSLVFLLLLPYPAGCPWLRLDGAPTPADMLRQTLIGRFAVPCLLLANSSSLHSVRVGLAPAMALVIHTTRPHFSSSAIVSALSAFFVNKLSWCDAASEPSLAGKDLKVRRGDAKSRAAD